MHRLVSVISMKKTKQIISFVFALIALMTYLLDKPKHTTLVWQENQGNPLEIILLDEDKECVPFTFYSQAASIEEKIVEIVNAMKVNQIRVEGFYGFLAADTEAQSVKVDQSILEIDFNEAFCELDPTLEIKAMEAMCYLINQFDEIEKLHITINQKPFTGFKTYSINMPLEKESRLNHFEMLNAKLHKTDSFSVAIIKEKKDKSYFTLKTMRSSAALIESLKQYYCDENSIFLKNGISLKTFDLKLEEDKIILNLSKECLNENYQCDEVIMKSILLTLKSNFKMDKVEIWIEGVLMEEVNLSTISFNEI